MLRYQAPRARELPPRLVAKASQRGFRLEPDAARLLVERLGERTLRLANELERLALWAGPEGEVTVADLEAMVADTSEEAAWTLSDAIVARDPRGPPRGRAPGSPGEGITPLIYQAARRLREAHAALLELEAGRPRSRSRRGSECTPTRRRC